MNAIHFVGNLTADPKLVTGPSGKPRASFTVAVNEGQDDNKQTHFVNVAAFGTLGENLAGSLTKGQRVVVIGRLNTYKKEVEIDGEVKNITMVGFNASAVGPDLRFATATVAKVARNLEFDPDEAARGNSHSADPDEGNDEADEAPAASSAPSAGSSKSKHADESDDF